MRFPRWHLQRLSMNTDYDVVVFVIFNLFTTTTSIYLQVISNNTLVIKTVERMDVGHYKCVATNYLGQVSSEAMVSVNGNILYTFFFL